MKKGQGEVITIVLIILLVLAAIVIVWNVVYSTIKKSSEQVNVDIFSNKLEIEKSRIYTSGNIELSIKKTVGNDNLTKLKIILSDSEGNAYSTTKEDNLPSELETRTYIIDYSELNYTKPIKKISVSPIFGTSIGMESTSEEITLPSDKDITPVSNILPGWKMDLPNLWSSDGPETTIIEGPDGKENYAHDSIQDGNPSNCYNWTISNQILVDVNKKYKFTIWIKSEDLNVRNYFGFYLYNAGERIAGVWDNPYFKVSYNDPNQWIKWTGYLFPKGTSGITGCGDSSIFGPKWCMANSTAYVVVRFGSCYGSKANKHTYYMYPKMEEVSS